MGHAWLKRLSAHLGSMGVLMYGGLVVAGEKRVIISHCSRIHLLK